MIKIIKLCYYCKTMTIQIKTMNTICPVPWMHLAFEPNGRVIPCCLTSTHGQATIGNINDQSIDRIWNGLALRSIRKQMIDGEEPAICNKCFDREKVTGESGRIYHIRDFQEVIKTIPIVTEEDGTCNEMKLRYWDFRFSNLCNYKCRSCGPTYSSSWVPDAKKMGWISEQDKVWNIEAVDNKTNFDFLKEQVQHVEKVYFAGGEPLLMDEHWQILDMLYEAKRFNVRINYNTNCSTLTYNKKSALDYWRHWDNCAVEVWPSLDEIDERAELIRSGTVWSKVESNLKELLTLDNIIIRPGLTIGAWNCFRLPEIITRLVDLGVIKSKKEFGYHYNNFFINMLLQPEYYNVSILPGEFKKQTVVKLKAFVEEFNAKFETDITDRFTHIIHELETVEFDADNARRFVEVTNRLDMIRNEDTWKTIPELEVIKDELLKLGK